MTTIPIIQNQDVVARRKDYDHLAEDQLLVHGTFFTIQGEGPFAGWPAFFIRLGGCNFGAKTVACQWCDTAFHLQDSKVTGFYELESLYHSYRHKCNLIVITGGEPCLQPALPAFVSFLKRKWPNTVVQIESNGTQLANMRSCYEAGAYLVCSPKAVRGRYSKEAPASFVNSTGACYKFVVSADKEDPHHTIPDWAYIAARYIPVYVSPMTVYRKPYRGEISSSWDSELVDQQATAANYSYAATLAMEHGLYVSIQSHTFFNLP